MRLPSLDELLDYKNERLIRAYQQNHPDNRLSAEQALQEILKYLWLVRKHQLDKQQQPNNETLQFRLAMLFSMREIDDMWHEFILYTKDYTAFCQHYFGDYLHHQPDIFINAPIDREESDNELQRMLPYIHAHFGDETLKRWFADYLQE